MAYDSVKSHKKVRFHPLSRKHIFGKITGRKDMKLLRQLLLYLQKIEKSLKLIVCWNKFVSKVDPRIKPNFYLNHLVGPNF